MVLKNVFLKARTGANGTISFTIDKEYADIAQGLWRAKIEHLAIQISAQTPPSPDKTRPVSCSVNFCLTLQSKRMVNPQTRQIHYENVRQPVKMAFNVIKGDLDEFVLLATPGNSEYVSFQHPPSELSLCIRNEMTEAPLPNTQVFAMIILTRDE